MLTFWDDFSHWGLAIKNMYYLNDLYTAPASSATFLDYPPASQVWQYIVLKVCGVSFREDVALFANGLFCVALLVYPLKAFGWKKIVLALACAISVLVIPSGINAEMYTRLLVDGMLGVLFFYVVATHFMAERHQSAFLHTALGCFALAMVKKSGVALALMAVLVIVLDLLVVGHRKWAALDKAGKHGVLRGAIAPVAGLLAGWLGLQVYLAVMNIAARPNAGLLEMAKMAAGDAAAHRQEIVTSFFTTFFTVPGNGAFFGFPSAAWFAFYAVLFVPTVLLLQKNQRGRYIFAAVAVAACHLLFMLGLLASYMVVFSPGEAQSLASFFRYEATVATGCMLFFVVGLLLAVRDKGWMAQLAGGLAGCLLAAGVGGNTTRFFGTLRNAPYHAATTQNKRVLSIQTANRVRELGEENPRLYLISITDGGEALLKLDYELLPITLAEPDHPTSIAIGDYYGGQVGGGNAIYSPEEWGQILYNDYDYVYLYSIDGYFTTYYRDLFEEEDDIVNDVMLRVIRYEDGTVSLRRWQPAV